MSNDENKYGLVEDVSESEELVEDEQVQDEEWRSMFFRKAFLRIHMNRKF